METVLECPAEVLSGIAALGRRKSSTLRIGVLFGLHENGVVRVQSWQSAEPLEQRVIPPADDECLQRVLASGHDQQAVGFFVYRNTEMPETTLTEPEAEIFERVFPNPWQVALAMREKQNGCSARFFAHRR